MGSHIASTKSVSPIRLCRSGWRSLARMITSDFSASCFSLFAKRSVTRMYIAPIAMTQKICSIVGTIRTMQDRDSGTPS